MTTNRFRLLIATLVFDLLCIFALGFGVGYRIAANSYERSAVEAGVGEWRIEAGRKRFFFSGAYYRLNETLKELEASQVSDTED